MKLEKINNNKVNIEEESLNETYILDEIEGDRVITGLINDSSISDDYWEKKGQHIRDDLCFQLERYGCIDVKDIADFHGPIVYLMVEKYL